MDGGQFDAIIPIIMSSATLEALIMEISFTAGWRYDETHNPPLKTVADIIDSLEDERGKATTKYQLAKFILTGSTFDRGSKPFSELELLFKLRNAIIHLKPDTFEEPKIVEALRSRKLCGPRSLSFQSWLGIIATRAVARWACNVVVDMVESIRESLPEDDDPTMSFLYALLCKEDYSHVQ